MSAQVWEVIGGEELGGILVREGEGFNTSKCSCRLATGALVQEVECVGLRLHYRLLEGQGPAEGWVSLSVKGKELLQKRQAGLAEDSPAREPGSEAVMLLVTAVEGQVHGTWRLQVSGQCMTIGDWKEGIATKQFLDDDIVCKFADKLRLYQLYDAGRMGPRLSDGALLPVEPQKVFVSGPGAVQSAFARGLQHDFGPPIVPEARRLCVRSSFPTLHGGYEETFGGSLIFQRRGSPEEAAMALFRDQDRGGSGGNRWFFGESGRGFTSFVIKSEDDAATPEEARWPSGIECILAFDASAAEGDQALFEDEEFPHTGESVGNELVGQLPDLPQWLPARRLWSSSEDMKLFDGIQPNDLLQGQIGDCWLIAAMAALAEFPQQVELLFIDRGDQVTGRYQVQLFNHREGEWNDVVVDEFVPCLPKEWWELEGTPLFARPNGNEMWCVLLEKAMAKLFGTYSGLLANNCGVAFRAFTGATDNFMWMRPEAANGAWLKYKLVDRGFDYDPCMQDPDFCKEPDDFFRVLEESDEASYLMSASLQVSHSVEYRRPDGLVEGHAYTLLKVARVEDHRLLLLRNPWGNDCEWNGPWSDESDTWQRYPMVKAALRPSVRNDGLFWMAWEDFTQTWDMINICTKPMLTGEDKTKHLVAATYVGVLARRKAKVRSRKDLQPTVVLKVDQSGDDCSEAQALPAVQVGPDQLLRALLHRLFQELDVDGDGRLQLHEAIAGLSRIFGPDSEMAKQGESIFRILDGLSTGKSGFLTEEEFVGAGLDYRNSSQDSDVTAALKAFNAHHSLWAAIRSMKLAGDSGSIGPDEIAELLKGAAAEGSRAYSDKEWQQAAVQLITGHDRDQDGALNRDEWLALMADMTSLCDASGAKSQRRHARKLLHLSKAVQGLQEKRNAMLQSKTASFLGSFPGGEPQQTTADTDPVRLCLAQLLAALAACMPRGCPAWCFRH